MYQHPGNRPINLNLLKLRFPINAWLSAGHRISGVLLFLSLLGYLGLLNLMIFNEYVTLDSMTDHWIVKLVHSGFWLSVSYHWLSGLRHLLAEHFTQPEKYQRINSPASAQALLLTWIVASLLILQWVWLS